MRLTWTGISWSGGPLWTGEGLLAGTEGAQRLQAWTEGGRRLKSGTEEARVNGVKLMEALEDGGPLCQTEASCESGPPSPGKTWVRPWGQVQVSN